MLSVDDTWGRVEKFLGQTSERRKMEVLSTIVQFILSMGAAVFVPLIMFIFGKIVGMKTGDAFMAALTLGIAFTGMNVITRLGPSVSSASRCSSSSTSSC